MEKLKSLNSLLISQKKEWGEILTGFDKFYYASKESFDFGSMKLRLLIPRMSHWAS